MKGWYKSSLLFDRRISRNMSCFRFSSCKEPKCQKISKIIFSGNSFRSGTPPVTGKTARPPAVDEATRKTLKNALLGMLGMSQCLNIFDWSKF